MSSVIPYESEIEEKDRTIIEEYILTNLKEYEKNSSKLTELTIEAISSLSAGKTRTEFLANQGFLKNILNSVTGQNRKIRGEIDYNYAIVKNASVKMIEHLAQQNKITYEGLIYINNKLNKIEENIEEELITICNNIRNSFNVILEKINEESIRIDSLEKKVQLLEFRASINMLEFDNIKYFDMDNIEKIICLSNDLFSKICYLNKEISISKEHIYMIKSILLDFNINMNQKIKVIDFYNKLIEKPNYINKIFDNIEYEINISDYIMPILSGIKKIEKLNNEEQYLVYSIFNMIKSNISEENKEENKLLEEKSVKINLINEYGVNISNFNYNLEITNYELIILIMNELKMISKQPKNINKNELIEININEKIELANKYFNEKKYKKAVKECDYIFMKEKKNKEALNIKIESIYKLLIMEIMKYEKPLSYKEISKIFFIKKDYENAVKYLNKYLEEYSFNKDIYKYKNKLKYKYKKIKMYQKKINKKLEKTSDKNKKEYLEFVSDFWGIYLDKI